MKKILIIFGAVSIIITIGIAALIGFVAYNGGKLDSSSKSYVDENIPPIIASWSVEELMSRSSPQLKEIGTPQQFEELFEKLSQLGSLKRYEQASGDSKMSYTSQNGKMITAKYSANAVFANGEAKIDVELIQVDDQWRILSFYVNSPFFMK